jgi:manganese transport protein
VTAGSSGGGAPAAGAGEVPAPVALSALEALRSRGRLRGSVALLGPAFVAAVAYVDPGNFATNFAAGARFGYALAWVIVGANLMAMLVQYESAKVGIATGRDLPELCREHFGRPVSGLLWVQAELVAMATDLAEFVGAAVGLYLLFGVPLFPAGVVTAVVAFGILALEQRGYRRFELAVAGLLGVVFLGFAYDLVAVGADPGGLAAGLVPGFAGTDSVLLACGIIGATVMPHVVYLHSALTQNRIVGRNGEERKRILRFEKIDIVVAMSLAGLVNLSMMMVAAALFHGSGMVGIDSIDGAFDGLKTLVSGNAATVFGVALLASGFASSSVGTMAGQVVMQGFIRRRIPIFVRRAVTLAPALFVLGIGFDPTDALVASQVVLSFGIPFALVPLLIIASKRDVMGSLTNPRWLTAFAGVLAAMIIGLNVFLLQQVFFG